MHILVLHPDISGVYKYSCRTLYQNDFCNNIFVLPVNTYSYLLQGDTIKGFLGLTWWHTFRNAIENFLHARNLWKVACFAALVLNLETRDDKQDRCDG